MSLDEKIGQMTQAERAVVTPSDVITYRLGSVLSGGGSAPSDDSPAGWATLVEGLRRGALATPLGIPILYGVDAVHGDNNVMGSTIFPHDIGLGATRDPGLVEKVGRAVAEEVAGAGAPSVLASAKHYLGDGGTTGGVDQGDTQLSEAGLRAIHLPPFKAAVDRGVGSIMVSFSSWHGSKLSGDAYGLSYEGPLTPPVTTPPASTPPASATCRVAYTTDDRGTGFTADVAVTNTGTAALDGWTSTWTFAGGQKITNGWNAVVSQSGTQARAGNPAWATTLPPGARTAFGFQATSSGSNPAPTDFALNGARCTS